MTSERAISFVTTPIVMAVMYFGIITPVGLLCRLAADNPIVQRATSNGYWKTHAKGAPLIWSGSFKVLDESHQ